MCDPNRGTGVWNFDLRRNHNDWDIEDFSNSLNLLNGFEPNQSEAVRWIKT